MSNASDKREVKGFEAIIVAALRRATNEVCVPKQRLPELTDRERKVIASVDTAFVQRVLAEEALLPDTDTGCKQRSLETSAPGIGLNRAEGIDPDVAKILEQKRAEIISRRAKREDRA